VIAIISPLKPKISIWMLTDHRMMKLNAPSYQTENDYTCIRDFLREVIMLNDRRMLSWPVVRLDYWRWHGIYNLGNGSLEEDVFLWETEQGRIAAVLNCEELGTAYLQVHPAYKSAGLEERMIVLAEERLRENRIKGGSVLRVWTDSGDIQRIAILQKRGFTHLLECDEHQWRRSLELSIPESKVPAGYTIRPLGDRSEIPSRSWASWRAFHSTEPDENYQQDWTWYLNILAAPLYQPDLDLVAIDSGGEVVAFTTIWYDEPTHCGVFEPVGCMPEHQRRGLGRALMCEGMHRLKKLGATLCMTSGGTPHANGLYQAVLGPVHDLYQPWEKRWL
jgi:mycothiol synthase